MFIFPCKLHLSRALTHLQRQITIKKREMSGYMMCVVKNGPMPECLVPTITKSKSEQAEHFLECNCNRTRFKGCRSFLINAFCPKFRFMHGRRFDLESASIGCLCFSSKFSEIPRYDARSACRVRNVLDSVMKIASISYRNVW